MQRYFSLKRLVILLAFLKFIFPFLVQSAYYEPHRDEFLYLAEGNHPAWGFMEVPPLLSVFARLVHLCGDGIFWIKFWPSLFGALTYLVVARTILSLGGKSFSLLLGFLPFVTGAYLRVHFLFQPNFLEIFFWTLIAWSMIRFIQTDQKRWIYLFGVSVGLGLMSKYSVSFFTAAILIGLLCTRQRKFFANKHFYFACLLAIVIFLPNLLWQYHHHFPMVYHMKELKRTQLQYVSPTGFLIDQLIMNIPVVFIWLAGLVWLLFSRKAGQYRFVGVAYITVIVILLIGQGKNYYALGAYPILFAFGAYGLEQLTAARFRWLRYVFVLIPVVIGVLALPLLLPVFPPEKLAAYYQQKHMERTGTLKWEDLKNHPLPQDFSDMLGWEEMTKKMAEAYSSLSAAEKNHTILFCDNYGQAGAINYYGPKYGLPAAYSDNASFLYWMPETFTFMNIILLTDDHHEMQRDFIKNFESAVLSDSVTSPYARERGDLIIILKGANDKFQKFFIEKIEKDKAKAKW